MLTLLAALVIGLIGWATGRAFQFEAEADLSRRAQGAASSRAATLRSELDRFRLLPFVLAQDRDVGAVLQTRDHAAIAALDRKLESLAGETRVPAIYLVASDGLTLAASNWRTPLSFEGQNYAFRPYFREALERGYAEMFALGTVSGAPGLYLARRVESASGAAGVIVVKVQFNAVEADWARTDTRVFVADQRGVVLITSTPEWRFHTLAPIPAAEIPALRQSRQYGEDARLPPLPLALAHGFANRQEFAVAVVEAAAPGWRLYALLPAQRLLLAAENSGRAIGALSAALILIAVFMAISARARARRESARQDMARRDLETRVVERTEELRNANTQLLREMEDRRRAEAHLQVMQDELVQATKLAVLGQITAGVAHEINQPVSAIRAYVDASDTMIGRGDLDHARQNLTQIAAMTDRIGTITQELRAFSRKSAGKPEPVCMDDALDGALLLVAARARSTGVEISRSPKDARMVVMADRTRIEQVMVNLLQNAFDALDGVKDPRLDIRIERRDGLVALTIGDNGPGVPIEIAEALFMPFVTTKPQGLGLGLVISRDICAEFGGSLDRAPSALGGAAFTLKLPAPASPS